MMAAQQQITCPKCGKQMDYLGNIDGRLMLSYPAKYREVYTCDRCKVKKTIIVDCGVAPASVNVDDYEEI